MTMIAPGLRPLKVKFILPALTDATDPYWRPIKYSLFPPLGMATLAEIERLPGRHLYFLDDHLLGDRRFAETLFDGMKGMGRLFQGAATVDSILRDGLIERAAEAGLRSIFVGFETLTPDNLKRSNKHRTWAAITRLLPTDCTRSAS